MAKDSLLPRLPSTPGRARSMTWATQFTSEGRLGELLKPVETSLKPPFELTYRTRFPENHIGLYASLRDAQDEALFEQAAEEITRLLGPSVFAIARDADPLPSLEEVVVRRLQELRHVVTTVESATGGGVAARLTDVPGASQVFWGGLVTYDNSCKEEMGDVSPVTLEQHGAVSEATARELAENGLALMIETVTNRRHSLVSPLAGFACLSVTGIAGPGGGTPSLPVGTAFIALARQGSPTVVEKIEPRVRLDRARYRQRFAQHALDLLRRHLAL